ncbi:MAG: ThiF family adenylyltransferase [Planctomycetaceae bacterium]|jgi:molybdopterin/thiamine biosynthesis adenylyltransferase|nr:ThiF family adenylyltransferase [Planctomycetaceae bacterium]
MSTTIPITDILTSIKHTPRHATVYYPQELENSESELTGYLYGYFHKETNSFNVTLFVSEQEYEPITAAKSLQEIGRIFSQKPLENEAVFPENADADNYVYAYRENGKLIFEAKSGYCKIDENGNKSFVTDSVKVCKTEPYSLKMDLFSRNTGILETDVMLNKGVLVIGCGSVGSLVALELARAGVGRFLLIDDDILGYHNICRHQCGIADVGKYKTDAVKERLLQINPKAVVELRHCQIQEVPLEILNEFCNSNTIVIGGADNREGDLYINPIAIEIGMPFVAVGCWERAFVGEIFYWLPQKDMSDYKDFITAIGGISGRTNQNTRFYTNEQELAKTIFEPGISADINFISIIAVKLAIDILNQDNPNYVPRLLPHLTQYTLICNTNNEKIGGKQVEMFSYPLQVTTSIKIPHVS